MTVLFTDIDGTLIDHHTYDAGFTHDAVHALIDKGVAVVFCSSKTFAEQHYLQQQLGIRQPMIVENGGGVF
jgi:HAD superfamily hydrolase (TIGR01484 family)